MTNERINEIIAIMDRAKEYDGINYALERAVYELIAEVKRLQTDLEKERKISDYLRSPVQKGNW